MEAIRNPSRLDRVRPLRRLARAALGHYGLREARLNVKRANGVSLVRVMPTVREGSAPAESYALRIYGSPDPGRDPTIASERALRSKLRWLGALRSEAGLSVPDPVFTREGSPVCRVRTPYFPEPRNCVLLRWVPGKVIRRPKSLSREDLHAAGAYVAGLHRHAGRYSVPADFSRRRYDGEHIFGRLSRLSVDGKSFYSPDEMRVLNRAAKRVRQDLGSLGEDRETFGLIHCDLNPANLVFDDGSVAAIDFDNCGWGYYLHDLALLLFRLEDEYRGRCAPPQNALLDGYRSERPLPRGFRQYIGTFMAIRRMFKMDLILNKWTGGEPPATYPLSPDFLSHSIETLHGFTAGKPYSPKQARWGRQEPRVGAADG